MYSHIDPIRGRPPAHRNQHDHDQQVKSLLHKEFPVAEFGHILKFLGADFARTSQGMLRMEESHPTYISPCKEVCNWKKKTNTPPCDPMHYRA